MLAAKILYGVFLCTILTSSTVAQEKALKFLADMSVGIVDFGRLSQCLASKGYSSEIESKVNQAFDVTFSEVMNNIDDPLTDEKFATKLRVMVLVAIENLKAIDPECHGYCPKDNVEYALEDIGVMGKATEAVGLTLSCMLDDRKPELLAQFSDAVASAWKLIAASADSSKTSVNRLAPGAEACVKDLQKLYSRCVNIKRVC